LIIGYYVEKNSAFFVCSGEADWSKCFICQEDKHGALKSPPMKIDLAKSGYRTLSKNIPEFAKINEMPNPPDIRRIDEGDGIEAALLKNEAKYHESCRLMFNNTKLQRAQKRHQHPDTSLSDVPSSFKFTRKSSTAPTEERSLHLEECFICEKQTSRSELREAMTMQLNTIHHQCAHNLQDQNLLAKLSAGDVVAQEVKYHEACLTSLYNKKRAHLRMKQSMTEDADAEGEINQIVFAEFVTHVVETQRGSTGGVVFKLDFKLLGNLLKGTGYVTALSEADIASLGTAGSFLTVSNLAKTRQAHQITACCLYDLIKKAYQHATDNANPDDIEISDIFSWCSEQEKTIPQFQLWTTILNLELLVLSFVRSYRESDFRLYKESLSSLIPYFVCPGSHQLCSMATDSPSGYACIAKRTPGNIRRIR
jgi:hypothetical protein